MSNKGNKISANRIAELRDVLKNTDSTGVENMVSDLRDAIKVILISASQTQQHWTKTMQMRNLNKFLSTFISSLNYKEYLDLLNKVEYYEEKYKKHKVDMEWYEDWFDVSKLSLSERIKRLLVQWSIIPKVEKYSEFYNEMRSLLTRYGDKINIDAKKQWFSLVYISPENLLEIFNNDETWMYELVLWEELESYLSSVRFSLSLTELSNIKTLTEDEFEVAQEFSDKMKYEIMTTKVLDNWINKDELIEFFREKWYLIDWEEVCIYTNNYIEIRAHLFYRRLDGENMESCKFEIYAKKRSRNISSTQFVEVWIWKLSAIVEQTINEIYNKFWAPKKRFTFDLWKLYNVENWFEDELDYSEDDLWTKDTSSKTSKENKEVEVFKEDNKLKNKKKFDIILEEPELKELNTLKFLFKDEEYFLDHWVDIPKWTILFWPPWTWKTLFAKVISNDIDAEFISISIADILKKWVWDSEKNLKSKFVNARKLVSEWKKVIMFFDEADWLFEKRTWIKTHKEWLISVLLEEMDWINEDSLKNIFVFFTTNRLNSIDNAILSRFDKKVKIDLPNKENRIKLIKVFQKQKMKRSKNSLFGKLDYDKLSEKLEWKSWRFIKQLMNNTVLAFAQEKLYDPDVELISTQDILDKIKITDAEINKSQKKIWFDLGDEEK